MNKLPFKVNKGKSRKIKIKKVEKETLRDENLDFSFTKKKSKF